MIFPDYGGFLLGQGYDGVELVHYDVPIHRISLVRPGFFTSPTNLIVEGVEYAASFDLSHEVIVKLCRKASPAGGDKILMQLASLVPGQSIDLSPGWIVGHIAARLGSPQHAPKEVFVPLVVEDIG